MKRSRTKKLVTAAALGLVIAGGAVAAVTAADQVRGKSSHPATLAHARRVRNVGAAARYLGLSNAQLRSELQAGRTLAQIADASPGKSAAGLIDAIVAAKRAKLAKRSGALTRQVTAAVNKPGGPSASRRGAHARGRHGHRARRHRAAAHS